MSIKLALETLKSLGLTDTAARLYIYLAKKGPHKENVLAVALNLTQSQLNLSLENLMAKGMIGTTPNAEYFAVPLERVLEDFAEAAKEQAKAMQASRDKLLSARAEKAS